MLQSVLCGYIEVNKSIYESNNVMYYNLCYAVTFRDTTPLRVQQCNVLPSGLCGYVEGYKPICRSNKVMY